MTVILVDMDGPIAGFDEAFFARCAAEGWPMDCGPEGQTHRYATGHILDPRHSALARLMVETEGWYRGLPIVDGAAEGLERLAGVAEVWICSKPHDRNPTCRDEKHAWLADRLGPHWARRLILAPDKSLIVGAVLLDDAPKPAWFERALWVPVIYPAPYNGPGSGLERLPRWSWADPVDELLACASSRVPSGSSAVRTSRELLG